jgi:hypothetical protein
VVAALTLGTLVMLSPVACGGTAMGYPPGAADPNTYSCSSLIINPLAVSRGSGPVWVELQLRALLAALVVGAAGSLIAPRFGPRETRPRE